MNCMVELLTNYGVVVPWNNRSRYLNILVTKCYVEVVGESHWMTMAVRTDTTAKTMQRCSPLRVSRLFLSSILPMGFVIFTGRLETSLGVRQTASNEGIIFVRTM